MVCDGGVLDEVEGLGCAQVAGDGEGTEGEAETGEEVEEGLGLVAWGLGRGVGGVRRGGVLAGDAGVAARGGRGEDSGQWTVESGHGKWHMSKGQIANSKGQRANGQRAKGNGQMGRGHRAHGREASGRRVGGDGLGVGKKWASTLVWGGLGRAHGERECAGAERRRGRGQVVARRGVEERGSFFVRLAGNRHGWVGGVRARGGEGARCQRAKGPKG